MKITNNSRKLISFFVENNCIPSIKQTKKTDTIFANLYHEMHNGFKYIENMKNKIEIKMHHSEIHMASQIPKPTTFNFNDFPDDIQQRIDNFSISSIVYSLKLFNKNINISFVLENIVTETVIKCYNKYVDNLLVWLYIITQYASSSCATDIHIYIYHTSLTKKLPQNENETLGETHVNTAFTRTCPANSEIVIFRKEEWFKVFIHETFHNFGLDFSNMSNHECHLKILSMFPVNSEVNLFEAYAEFWARTINALFCSYNNMKHKDDINDFLTNAEFLINYERIYSFFQMVKVLDFMNLDYNALNKPGIQSNIVRQKQYKENTSVLSYYVITLILINNYQDFILWCNINNTSLFQFKQTATNQHNFCKFIEKKYKLKPLLEGVKCSEQILHRIKQTTGSKKNILFLLTNLRMSLCELG
jgi:hypothetical protein